jgi:hypothetical protein
LFEYENWEKKKVERLKRAREITQKRGKRDESKQEAYLSIVKKTSFKRLYLE